MGHSKEVATDDSLAPTQERKKSRRGLLALVGAGGTAAVATLLGRTKEAEVHGTVHYDSSTAAPAVHGNNTDSGVGVWGESSSGMGVCGSSVTGNGVYGDGDSDSRNGVGVKGSSANSTGVKGEGKPGVYGLSYSGSGVRGDGTGAGSIGVFANNTPGRLGLRTRGQVEMDCARKVTLSNRTNTVTLPTGIRAGSNAIVLAMVQGASGNGAFVRRAFRVDSTHIRITFDKRPANPTAVGYWVVQTG